MTITIPDDPALAELDEEQIRAHLVCGAYAAGHVSRSVAARMAAMDRATFDQLLIERRIPAYDEERWSKDLETLRGIRHP